MSRPAREPLDVHDEPMCWLKRFWHRGHTLSHRYRAAYAAPLIGRRACAFVERSNARRLARDRLQIGYIWTRPAVKFKNRKADDRLVVVERLLEVFDASCC